MSWSVCAAAMSSGARAPQAISCERGAARSTDGGRCHCFAESRVHGSEIGLALMQALVVMNNLDAQGVDLLNHLGNTAGDLPGDLSVDLRELGAYLGHLALELQDLVVCRGVVRF